MPKKNRDHDDDDEEDDESFDFFKAFGDPSKFFSNPNFIDPSKMFKSKQFRNMFKDIFEKILSNLPPEFRNLAPEDIGKSVDDVQRHQRDRRFYMADHGERFHASTTHTA